MNVWEDVIYGYTFVHPQMINVCFYCREKHQTPYKGCGDSHSVSSDGHEIEPSKPSNSFLIFEPTEVTVILSFERSPAFTSRDSEIFVKDGD